MSIATATEKITCKKCSRKFTKPESFQNHLHTCKPKHREKNRKRNKYRKDW